MTRPIWRTRQVAAALILVLAAAGVTAGCGGDDGGGEAGKAATLNVGVLPIAQDQHGAIDLARRVVDELDHGGTGMRRGRTKAGLERGTLRSQRVRRARLIRRCRLNIGCAK